ncbi:MAG: D-alanine--D-alanine ligase [bacterium]|nr:MAG: D-alanine--D-alanine ligase [bacterium]
MQKKRIGLIFGGVSPEHEISIITFDQVFKNINREKYDPVPIYITPDGDWVCDDRLKDVTRYSEIFTGSKSDLRRFNRKILPPYPLRHETGGFFKKMLDDKIEIDVAFPLVHGSGGEDGSLQGLLELADIPYVGAGIGASAVGMDKILQKQILASAGLPLVHFTSYLKSRIESEHEAVQKEIIENFRFPVFVKPASAGSSVGITKVDSPDFLAVALDEACRYDRKLIIEQSVENPREINCAVIGDDESVTTSVCEEVFSEGFLDYRQKYLKGAKKGGVADSRAGGMESVVRTIPADVDEKVAAMIHELTRRTFRALDCCGMARVDFLMDESGDVTITELNSIPGSLAFYLWEKSGLPFTELLDRLIDFAFSTYRRKKMLRKGSDFNAVKRYLKSKQSAAG